MPKNSSTYEVHRRGYEMTAKPCYPNCESYFKKNLFKRKTYLVRIDDKEFTDNNVLCCENRRKKK